MNTPILSLAGGVGGAKLALGLSKVLTPDELTIVVNTGDDDEFYGLHVSPDLDTVTYTLAGLTNPETGWGLAGDTFNALGALKAYGAPAWFNLGDKDLATHIRRTELLKQGSTLSEVIETLSTALGVKHSIVPMSDDRIRTIIKTDDGELPFQVYFVKHRYGPVATGLRYAGAEQARPAPDFAEALGRSASLVVCPSNPFLSIAPILAVPSVRERIEHFPGTRIVVSPIVGGQALIGPAAKLLEELGHDVSCVGVAKFYRGLCDVFVVDEMDRDRAGEIEALGMRVDVTNTVMRTEEDKVNLARHICEILPNEALERV